MIPLLNARIPSAASQNVADVLSSGYIGDGAFVQMFECALSEYLGVAPDHIVATSSGSAALYLACRLARVLNRSVISTPMTFVATNAAINMAGGRIEWADVERAWPQTCQINVDHVESLLDSLPDVAAVMAVCWAGWSPNLTELRELCDRRQVPLILDAAQAFGATWRDRPIHEYADITCYSFGPTKHVTCGDGGALVTHPRWAEHALRLAWFGMRKRTLEGEQFPSDQDVAILGFKFRMNNIAAAIGLASLKTVNEALESARQHASMYDVAFRPEYEECDQIPSPFLYTYDLVPLSGVFDVARVTNLCAGRGVQIGQAHRRNDDNCAFGGRNTSLLNTNSLEYRYISLPVGWWLSDRDVQHVISTVKDVMS